jgi:pimeloyl-ACP methyl ester carboxylesterase
MLPSHPWLLSFLVLAAAPALPAQGPYAVGVRDVSLPNPTGQGSASIACRVHHPAASPGTNVPVLAQPGGWPVVVFLHGFAAVGNNYALLGDALAAAGYVAVMHNTMQFDNQGQEYDGRALYPALVAANQTPGGPFVGSLDMTRAGLCGHSMGGGNVGNVLARNPGYRCGIALAPVTPRGTNAALVQVPMAIVVGTGDTIAPLATYSQPYYDALTGWRELKALYVLNNECNHTNLTGFALFGTAASSPVFERAKSVALGMLLAWLSGNSSGLEAVVGLAARAEPRLVSLAHRWQRPAIWPAGILRPGAATRVSIGSEVGPCGGLAAATFAAAPLPTVFGDLLLDAATAFVAFSGAAGPEYRFDGSVAVPNTPAMLGLNVPLQAYGTVPGGTLALGSTALLHVVP